MKRTTEERYKIGFVGLSAGAGATTLAFAATEYLAAIASKSGKTVTMLELNPANGASAGWSYDKVGIDRRFAGRSYTPIYRIASEGKPLKNVVNIDSGINWALRVPGISSSPEHGVVSSTPVLLRLLNNVHGNIIVCDISAYNFFHIPSGRDTLTMLLADLDLIICVFDPLPSRLLVSVPATEACRAATSAGSKTRWVFNKMNPGVDIREVIRFTGIKDFLPFPAIPIETVYRTEYACRSLATVPEAEAALTTLLR